MPRPKGNGEPVRRLFVARSDCTVLIEGIPWNFRKGIDLVDEGDPVLRIAPDRFEPFVPQPRRYGFVNRVAPLEETHPRTARAEPHTHPHT